MDKVSAFATKRMRFHARTTRTATGQGRTGTLTRAIQPGKAFLSEAGRIRATVEIKEYIAPYWKWVDKGTGLFGPLQQRIHSRRTIPRIYNVRPGKATAGRPKFSAVELKHKPGTVTYMKYSPMLVVVGANRIYGRKGLSREAGAMLFVTTTKGQYAKKFIEKTTYDPEIPIYAEQVIEEALSNALNLA